MEKSCFTSRYTLKDGKEISDFLDWFQQCWTREIRRKFNIETVDVWVSEPKSSIIFQYVVAGDINKDIETSPGGEVLMAGLEDIIAEVEKYDLAVSKSIHL